MNAYQDDRRVGGPRADREAERNSPASAVCFMPLLDPITLPALRSSYGDTAVTHSTNESTTPGRSSSPIAPGDESDNTPRSEVPSAVESPAGWHPQLPSSIFLPQPLTDLGYFSPRPLRYYNTNLAKSSPSSVNPSPTHSANPSTSSIHTGPFDPAVIPLPSSAGPVDAADRPCVHRDISGSSTATNGTIRANSVHYPIESLREYPQFPNQAYSALHSQNHPPAYVPQVLRTRASRLSQPASLSAQPTPVSTNASNHDRTDPLNPRTAGRSPASSPGLFTPNTPPVKPADGDGFYSSPYLHYTHRQIPKETHVADVEFDPISGRKIINQYEVIDELGRGVHGKVKLGKNLETGQFVAIKIVDRFSKRRRLGKTNSHEDKIRKEIAILKKARHPNIVSLLEVIDDPSVKKVYIVLEHVELGEVKWRTEGAKEIVLLEHRRYEREARGIFDSDSAVIEDEQIFLNATRRRERREKRRWKETQRKNKVSEHEAWSFEHGGDSDDESENASLSRVSTATAHQSDVGHSHHSDSGRNFPGESTARTTRDSGNGRSNPHTGLEGTMYGAYETEVTRGRTPSISGSASSASLDVENVDFVPEHFRYVPLMTLGAVRTAIRDTILGLEYLHYQGVVHRDIKPANLLQSKDHRIKISDFGVSYLGRTTGDELYGDQSESDAPDLDEAVELAKTVGTPAFYAPELCRTDEDADPLEVTQAIDVWALGVTLYCLVFGRVPFHDENPFVLMRKIAEEDVYIPRKRLKAVDEHASSRPSSHGRYFPPINSNKRASHDLEYEEVDDQLHDFLERLLEKDPRRRLTLKSAKMHPWLLRDIANPDAWYRETEPEKQTQGKKIELTKEDISAAVVPLTLRDKIVAGLRKTMGALVGRSASTRSYRGRARSSATPSDGLPSSAASSSSTISQDARRPSLRVDEALFAALRSYRESDHPLSQSQTASPEVAEPKQYFNGPSSTSRPHSPNVDLTDPRHASPGNSLRPSLVDRANSTMSTATSVRTIRPINIIQPSHRLGSPIQPPALPGTPLSLDTPSGSSLGGIFGGAARRVVNTVRRDKVATARADHNRARSIDRLVGADDDPHAQPSIALSDTVAAGHVDLPEALRDVSPKHTYASSPYSPQVYSYGQSDRLHPDSATNTPSRQSSISSVSSHFQEHRANLDERPSTRGSGVQPFFPHEIPEERFNRVKDDFIRRRLAREETQPIKTTPSRPSSSLSHSVCPSPDDDVHYRKKEEDEDTFGNSRSEQPSSSLETSPMSHPFHGKPLTSSSSEDQFTSGLSQSTSNPSIPSVISANSSIAAEDSIAVEPFKEVIPRSSEDTLNPAVAKPAELDGYVPDQIAESADDEDDDDSDNDFIEMTRPNRNSRNIGGARPSSVSNAELSRRRHHRSPTSSRTTRSGSGGTVKKSRSHGATPDATSPTEQVVEAAS